MSQSRESICGAMNGLEGSKREKKVLRFLFALNVPCSHQRLSEKVTAGHKLLPLDGKARRGTEQVSGSFFATWRL